MTDQDLISELLQIPEESQTIEFKRISGKKVVAKIIESIVAMANAEGGTIVLGIDDPEKTPRNAERIWGIEEDKDNFDAIGHELQRIIPPLSGIWPPLIIKDNSKDKAIALIRVPKATDSFCEIEKQVFVRLEKSNKKLSPQEIVKLSYAKGFQKADRELVDNIDLELLATDQYRKWKESRGITESSIKDVLVKTGLARKDENVIKPTRAAVLLFAEYPSDLMESKAIVRIMRFEGNTIRYLDKPNMIGTPKNISGPVAEVIKNAQDYTLSILQTGIRLSSGFVSTYQVPPRAIKEAITNAVIHRDYSIKRDIEVRIFEDRVEIESPGLFPFNITARNIGFVRAEGYRNDLIVKHLREFPAAPNFDLNEGVVAMRNEMNREGLYPPLFLTYPYLQDAVRVILLNEKAPSEWEKVKNYLESNSYVTNEIARKVTGIVQNYHMSRLLSKWVDQGLLVKSGKLKSSKYKLRDSEEVKLT